MCEGSLPAAGHPSTTARNAAPNAYESARQERPPRLVCEDARMGMQFGSPPERTVRALVTMKPTSEGGIKGGFDCPVVSFFHKTP